MNTKKFIDRLVHSARAVKPLASPEKRVGAWLLIAVICLFIGIILTGFSPRYTELWSSPLQLIETIAILLTTLAAAVIAFFLSVPGRFKGRMLWFIVVPFLVWCGSIGFRIWEMYGTVGVKQIMAVTGYACVTDLFFLGLIPSILIFVMVGLAAPLKKGATGMFAVMAGIGLAAFGLQFTCNLLSDPLHVWIFHVLPVIGIGVCGFFVGKLFLIKSKKP